MFPLRLHLLPFKWKPGRVETSARFRLTRGAHGEIKIRKHEKSYHTDRASAGAVDFLGRGFSF